MKVLWLTIVILPDVAKTLGLSVPLSGGWLDLLSIKLRSIDDISLYVCFPDNSSKIAFGTNVNETISYPFNTDDSNLECFFERVLDDCKPDVVNIYGTERKHALYMINACRNKGLLPRTIITIQGLISLCSKYYCAELPLKTVLAFSIRDLLKLDNILLQKRKYAVSGRNEVKALCDVSNIIGRTEWDMAFSTQINPNASYYSCNEILRKVFYNNQWDYDRCERHSIFVSASNYPLKGFHIAIEALRIIVKFFPDAKLYTTGINPVNMSFREKASRPYYHTYLGSLIKKYGLIDKVIFLGNLDEEKMCESYLRCNVFANCSSVENSSNAICEAMLLGIPVVASDVGGTASLLQHDSEGFIYQFGEEHMLANYIMRIFNNEHECKQISEKARKRAQITHNIEYNVNNLIKIYSEVIDSCEENTQV